MAAKVYNDWKSGQRVYVENVRGKVNVDEDNRVFVKDCLVSPFHLGECWRLFRREVGPDRWLAVVKDKECRLRWLGLFDRLARLLDGASAGFMPLREAVG